MLRITTFLLMFLLSSQSLAKGSQLLAEGSQSLAEGSQSLAEGSQSLAEGSIAGRIEGVMNGRNVVLSTLTSDYHIKITGDLAQVTLTQTFINPYDKPMNARYLFPLNRQAAVHAMRMVVGDEVIVARIDRIQAAKQTFARAKTAGKAAALLVQHRPNMFTQHVANLMPGLEIRIDIEYTHTVPRIDGAYELVVPMVVGPRFQPAGAGVPPSAMKRPEDNPIAEGGTDADAQAEQPTFGRWVLEQLPTYPVVAGVDIPEYIPKERVSLEVDLESPIALQHVASATHALSEDLIDENHRYIRLADDKVIDNRDFVLRYQLAAEGTSLGLLSHWQSEEGGYFSLLIEPPDSVAGSEVLKREMVFLLDCSGSMNGLPIEASKTFMLEALSNLRRTDSFRIIRFSDSATEFSHQPLLATRENVRRGLRYANRLHGSGGTVMTSGIHQALAVPAPDGVVRNVIFLTDGYIGNEEEVLELVHDNLGDARLFAFGIGAGVNRYLLNELGRVGRGFTRYLDPTKNSDDVHDAARTLAKKIQTPLLTDITVDWEGLGVTDVTPAELPDLYAGDSIRVAGRFTSPIAAEFTVSGRTATGRASFTARAKFDGDIKRPSVRRIWARNTVADRMHQFITPRAMRVNRTSNEQLKSEIVNLGLSYDLVTRWTAFVAVAQQRYNTNPSKNLNGEVPLAKVAGITNAAYGKPVVGYATPEPGMLLGLFVGLSIFAAWSSRRRRAA